MGSSVIREILKVTEQPEVIRVGRAHASREVFGALVRAKQAAGLHTNTIQQRAAARLLASFDFDAHVERIFEEPLAVG